MPSERSLLPYQKLWAEDESGICVIEKSRRIGISWAEALASVRHVVRKNGPGNVYYQSYAHDMTSGFIGDCAEWAEIFQDVADAVGEVAFEENGRTKRSFRIEAATGKEILAMTSAPRGFRSRGRPRDRAIIDEAAFVDDLAQVLKAARAFRIWGGQLRVISTHNGEHSEFHKLCEAIREGSQPGSIHRVTFRDALDQGLYRRICTITGATWSRKAEEAWEAEVRAEYGEDAAEELDCIPNAAGGHWLAWELIRKAEDRTGEAGDPQFYKNGSVFVGVDVARRRDLFVIVVLELVGDVLWVRQIIEARNITFSEQDQLLDEVVARYRPVRIAMDQTGMGEKPVEDAMGRYGELRVEGVLMSTARRLDVATALREVFEDARIRIPANNPALRADLRSVRTEEGPTGAPRLIVPRTAEGRGEDRSHTEKTHADRFWAMALAAAAAATGPVEFGYVPAPRGRSKRTEEGAGGSSRAFWRPDHSGDYGGGGNRRWEAW